MSSLLKLEDLILSHRDRQMVGDVIGIDEQCWRYVLELIVCRSSTCVLLQYEIIARLVVISGVVHLYHHTIDSHEEAHQDVEARRHDALQ